MKRARDLAQLKAAILARDLTHRELSRLCDCSLGTVGFLVSGRPVNVTVARRFARSLRRTLDSLFEDAASSTEPAIVKHQASA